MGPDFEGRLSRVKALWGYSGRLRDLSRGGRLSSVGYQDLSGSCGRVVRVRRASMGTLEVIRLRPWG